MRRRFFKSGSGIRVRNAGLVDSWQPGTLLLLLLPSHGRIPRLCSRSIREPETTGAKSGSPAAETLSISFQRPTTRMSAPRTAHRRSTLERRCVQSGQVCGPNRDFKRSEFFLQVFSRRPPGIGMISSAWARTQASASCEGLRPFSAAYPASTRQARPDSAPSQAGADPFPRSYKPRQPSSSVSEW